MSETICSGDRKNITKLRDYGCVYNDNLFDILKHARLIFTYRISARMSDYQYTNPYCITLHKWITQIGCRLMRWATSVSMITESGRLVSPPVKARRSAARVPPVPVHDGRKSKTNKYELDH